MRKVGRGIDGVIEFETREFERYRGRINSCFRNGDNNFIACNDLRCNVVYVV